jgi:carbonic anhydrase
MENWTNGQITTLSDGMFGEEDVKAIVSHTFTLSIEESSFYLTELLGNTPKVTEFIKELSKQRQPKQLSGAWKQAKTFDSVVSELGFSLEDISELKIYAATLKKIDLSEHFANIFGDRSKELLLLFLKHAEKIRSQKSNKDKKQGKDTKKQIKEKQKLKASGKLEKIGTHPNIDDREVCECMATVHELVSNCLECGKIICQYESNSICAFCGSELNFQNIKPSDKIAQKRIDTLLEYDRNSTARTHVNDTASDFDFGSDEFNKWLTPEQRALAVKARKEKEAKEEEQKRNRVITIDIVNRSVILERPKEIKKETPLVIEEVGDQERLFRNPKLKVKPPTFISKLKSSGEKKTVKIQKNRLQDDLKDYGASELPDYQDSELVCG